MTTRYRCPLAVDTNVPAPGCGNTACPHWPPHEEITRNVRGATLNRCDAKCPRYPEAGPCVPVAATKAAPVVVAHGEGEK
jgi:hypothetical protein